MRLDPEITDEQHLAAIDAFEEVLALPPDDRADAIRQRGLSAPAEALCLRMLKTAPSRESSEVLAPNKLLDTGLARDIYGSALVPNLPTEFDGYELKGLLGRGGMGLVYEARQIDIDRRVAIKVVAHQQPSKTLLDQFHAEIEFLARLEHPAIVQVLSSGTVKSDRGEIPYVALEYIDGTHFDRWAEATAKREPRPIAEKLAAIARAADHAHRRGVVHRDLKPSNLMIDEDGNPHVLDFGIAHEIDEDLLTTASFTRDSAVLGTMHYIAPEQLIAASDVDARADVYSLGVVLYEALTGERPLDLDGTHWIRAAAQIQALQPRALRAAREDLDADLELIVQKCLEKERSQRYATSSDLADDLQNWLSGAPVQARPPGAVYRLRRALRRNQFATAAVALVALLSIALGVRWAHQADIRQTQLNKIADLAIAAEFPTAYQRMTKLFPVSPGNLPAFEEWLRDYDDRVLDAAERVRTYRPEESLLYASTLTAAQKEIRAFMERHVPHMRRRAEIARSIAETWPRDHAAAWDRAIEEVAAHPLFDGLRLKPRWDLLPLFDERFPLPTFLHLPTHLGDPNLERYAKDEFPDERIKVEENTGLVLVLIPSVQKGIPGKPFLGTDDLFPGVSQPFFLGMHEVTIAQWRRMAEVSTEPNRWKAGARPATEARIITTTNPVESIPPGVAERILGHYGFRLPTRLESDGAVMLEPSSPSDSWLNRFPPQDIPWMGNFHEGDHSSPTEPSFTANVNPTNCSDWPKHCPVDQFPASASGLHGMLANVSEWQSDAPIAGHIYMKYCCGNSFLPPFPIRFYETPYENARQPLVMQRVGVAYQDVGVRVARSIDPPF